MGLAAGRWLEQQRFIRQGDLSDLNGRSDFIGIERLRQQPFTRHGKTAIDR